MFRYTALLLLVLTTTPAYPAVYYIDYVAGVDTANGTATTTPFKHCPGDPDATDNADITLAAGDTIVFRGGVVYEFDGSGTNYININASGTEGNVITYISGHVYSTPWGAGRAEIDCANATPTGSGVFSGALKEYFTIQGLEMYDLNAGDNDENMGLIGFSSLVGNITIDNNLLYTTNHAGIYASGNWDIVTNPSNPSNLTIKNNTIYDSWAHLIFLRAAWDNVLIENNNLDQAGSDPFSNGTGPRANTINLGYGGDSIDHDIIIRGNDLADTTNTGNKGLFMIQMEQDTIVVEDNYFHGYSSIGANHIVAPGVDLTYRNNVFNVSNPTYEGVLRFRSDQSDGAWNGIKIYNNTFVGDTDNGGGLIYFYGSSTDTDIEYSNVDIRNNIIDSDASTITRLIYIDDKVSDNTSVVDLATFTCDYNAYQGLRTDGDYFYVTNDSGGRTFAEWKTYLSNNSVTGADAHSTFGQVGFVDEANKDFRLAIDDIKALNLGTDLSAEGFTDDKNGVSRPQGDDWDIGAYEYIYGVNWSGLGTWR